MRVTEVLLWVVAVLLLVAATSVGAQTTYYVRPDGGTASQCTGKVDAKYPGAGTHKACAWNHPFQALPPGGPNPRIKGGDTLIIKKGSYRMGFGAPGTGECYQDGAYDCVMHAIPSGRDAAHPTRILGEGWNSGCRVPPELWAAERPWQVIDLTNSSHVEIGCLDITDHSSCIESHNGSGLPCQDCTVTCERDNPPFGNWGQTGIRASDSQDILLHDLNIHGLADEGIHAARLRDWTLNHVRIFANGWAGWNGDLADDRGNSNSGDIVFRKVEVGFNGCGETWPEKVVNSRTCWGQEAGGYGDGLGTGRTSGKWLFEDCYFHHNTSDGLDLLYAADNSTITVRRLVSEGNAGNQLKTAGKALVENSLLIGNCAFFQKSPLMTEGDQCRAMGNSLSIDLHRGNTVNVVNTTITGQGDCLMDAGCNDSMSDDSDPNCNGTERVSVRNVLFDGNTDWRQPWENVCLEWYDDSLLPRNPFDMEHNLVWKAKGNPCPGHENACGKDPKVTNHLLGAYDAHLRSGSPAINRGTTTGAPQTDLDGGARDSTPDVGAYEASAAQGGPWVSKVTVIPGSTYQLRITGARFKSGLLVYLGGTFAPWHPATFVSSTEVRLTGGNSLKARFPLNLPVRIVVVNPGGRKASANFVRTK